MAAYKIPKSWRTVTPFSRYLAMALFIVLPFLSFYLGVQYQKLVTPQYPPTQYIPSPRPHLMQVKTTLTPQPSCKPRPSCLDAKPRCMIVETADMCPPSVSPSQAKGKIYCTMEAKQCPDGSYVGRSGPNCEFAPCPGTKKTY